MKHNYVILSDSRDDIAETKAVVAVFPQLSFAGSATGFEHALDLVLDKNPALIFLEIQPNDAGSQLNLAFVSELYRYLSVVPQIIVTAKNTDLAHDALRYDVLDYLITPFRSLDLRKAMLRFEKAQSRVNVTSAPSVVPESIVDAAIEPIVTQPEIAPLQDLEVPLITDDFEPAMVLEQPVSGIKKPLVICVKSYGDYRFIEADDICYIQADNNSADIHLKNGEMVTAFKTLKQFENALPSPFVRIHNSYIVNIDYVSRIHTGNAVCYLKNVAATKLPFSKSYKENVDLIINGITNGNYLEF